MHYIFISEKKEHVDRSVVAPPARVSPCDWSAEAQNERLQGDVSARLIPEAPGFTHRVILMQSVLSTEKCRKNVPLRTVRFLFNVLTEACFFVSSE